MGYWQLNVRGKPQMDLAYHPGGVEILASCYRKQNKLRPDGPLGSYADLLIRHTHMNGKQFYGDFKCCEVIVCVRHRGLISN